MAYFKELPYQEVVGNEKPASKQLLFLCFFGSTSVVYHPVICMHDVLA